MSMHKSARNDTENPAGQVETLEDYIKQIKRSEPKKLTFEEWWKSRYRNPRLYIDFKICWEAAQENV